jgi:hypothetical protein
LGRPRRCGGCEPACPLSRAGAGRALLLRRRGLLLRRAVRVVEEQLLGRDPAGRHHADERELCDERRTREAEGAACAGGCGSASRADAGCGEHAQLETAARRDRQRSGKQLALALDLIAIRAAARAVGQMEAQVVAAQRRAARVRELLTDDLTRRVARLAAGDQAAARAEDERLHVRHLTAQHARHLDVREAAGLGEQERLALLRRQLPDVAQDLAQLRAPLHLLRQPGGGELGKLAELTPRAQHRQAAVACDREEPRLEGDLALVAGLEVVPRGCEGVLNGVLRLVRRPEHVPAEAEDRGAVALERDLESELVAVPHLLDEPVVAAQRQQPLRAKRRGEPPGLDSSGAHDLNDVPHPDIGKPRTINDLNARESARFSRYP